MLAARRRDARAHNSLISAHYLGAMLPMMDKSNRPPLQKLLLDPETGGATAKTPMAWQDIKASLQAAFPPTANPKE